MKVLLTIIGFVFFTQLSFAQYFTLTPDGFVSDDNKAFTVIDVPNKSQKQLYNEVLKGLSSIYNAPKEVLSLNEGQSITISAKDDKAISHKSKLTLIDIQKRNYKYDLSYSLTFQFKDGKIRVNRPSFECKRWRVLEYRTRTKSEWVYLHLVKKKNTDFAVFDKNGKLIAEETLTDLTTHFNSLITRILDTSG